jgi:hypothetical protein
MPLDKHQAKKATKQFMFCFSKIKIKRVPVVGCRTTQERASVPLSDLCGTLLLGAGPPGSAGGQHSSKVGEGEPGKAQRSAAFLAEVQAFLQKHHQVRVTDTH